MHLSQKLSLVLLFSILIAESKSPTFRGLTQAQVIRQTVPISYKHYIQEQYNLTQSEFNVGRGTFMIIYSDAFLQNESFIQNFNSFISFKKSQGFDVIVRLLSETGTTAPEIKAAILQELNSNPMLEYVLLLGDVDGVGALPSFYYGPENNVTDQKYGHLSGDDFIPDVFIGRFSVDSITELIVLINKTIHYHREPLIVDNEWLNRALVVAGNYSNTYPIPITPKWTSYWIRDELYDFGYSNVDTVFYPPVQQGATLIQSAINSGVGLVNYRGWGDANGWHYPEFHVSDIVGLNNGWNTPVFTSFVCNSNDFANNVDPCLGEALTRSGTPSSPKGGVAVIGPSDLHTSTKYNNIINAYMYDALLDNQVRELAPAMFAGQMGLLREFPQENGPGEAQEFYFHVYNILGDPSLNVYVGTPGEFVMNIDPVSNIDGFVQIEVLDEMGTPVTDAVVVILGNDQLLVKGMTGDDGRYLATVDVADLTSLDIYANHFNFIQGYEEMAISIESLNLSLTGYIIDDGEGSNDLVDLGEIVDVYPVLKNISTTAISAGNGAATSGTGVTLLNGQFSYPALAPGEEQVCTTPLQLRITSNANESVVLGISAQDSSWTAQIAIPVTRVVLQLEVSESMNLVPGRSFTPAFRITNHGPGQYDNIVATISTMSDSLNLIFVDMVAIPVDIDPWASVDVSLDYCTGYIGQVSSGSILTILVELFDDSVNIFSTQLGLSLFGITLTDPVSPSKYGYWAYDNTDVNYDQAPDFDWIELDPVYGGSGGSEYLLDDDDHVDVGLPFSFQYHGNTYYQMTVSSNGWISFIPSYIDYFWNYTIPMAMGPGAQIAAFWDDLEVIGTDSIRVYTRHDLAEGRFIIEWSRALNGFNETTMETFEIVLYSQSSQPTASEDGVIDIRYLEIVDIDAEKNYATVGIESPDQNDGIQYVFNNTYAPGAAPLEDSRAIRFTTESPVHYIAPLETDHDFQAVDFKLLPSYPNPFNNRTTIRFQVGVDSHISIEIFDLLGRKIIKLADDYHQAGYHQIGWNGKNQMGNTVASGTYFIVLKTGESTFVQKLLILK